MRWTTGGLGGALALLVGFWDDSPAAFAGPTEEPSGGLVALVEVDDPVDGIAPEQLREIRAASAAFDRRQAGKDDAHFLLPFFPQAGVLGRDLFLNNFTDQDPSADLVRDWDCSDYTYDGHHGHDSLIRSFREQAIGVPVFAALDGEVVVTHDGEPDMHVEWDEANRANYVLLDHGNGYRTLYLHFKRDSVAVSPGQAVRAGTQIGLTGSSGLSNWPHLHLETRQGEQWFEPSAGPCRSGESAWGNQPPVERDFYVADFQMTRGRLSLADRQAYLGDATARTATFLRGFQTVGVRADLRNLPAAATLRVRVLTPRGKPAYQVSGGFGNSTTLHLAFGLFGFSLDLSLLGTWRLQVEINGDLVINAPFRVVASSRQLTNRPPKKVTVHLTPSRPVEGEVLTCEVQTSLITEDPDYDVVAYSYEWRLNGRLVRAVTSAALTDLLPAGAAQASDKVTCNVTPSDVKARGPAALAARTVEP